MIKAIITDFDGTLADTFEANLKAYRCAFEEVGLFLSEEKYLQCFGLRYDSFMAAMGITDAEIANRIKETKKRYYPDFFQYIRPNKALIELISSFKAMGWKTAVASTARKENLMNVINYFGIADCFNLIYAGNDVKEGKPSPEIYIKTMNALNSIPENTLIFEDSEVGIRAAKASGAHCMIIPNSQFK